MKYFENHIFMTWELSLKKSIITLDIIALHGAPMKPVSKIGNPWGPIGEITNISFQIKFSVIRCISPESFCNSALIPMKNFVILKTVLDLFEIF
jgi:hypothetical protein